MYKYASYKYRHESIWIQIFWIQHSFLLKFWVFEPVMTDLHLWDPNTASPGGFPTSIGRVADATLRSPTDGQPMGNGHDISPGSVLGYVRKICQIAKDTWVQYWLSMVFYILFYSLALAWTKIQIGEAWPFPATLLGWLEFE